jgi:hypothetical protein
MAMNVDEQSLEIGKIYFSLLYLDENLAIPEIQTLVYLGRVQTDSIDSPKTIHLFQFADSYFSDGNWNELSVETKKEFNETPLMFFELGNIDLLFDRDTLFQELQSWYTRAI